MRPIDELINTSEPAWPLVQEWVAQAAVPVEILPTTPETGRNALFETQVTTRSPMGAIVLNSAGILIDSGWLRVLGAGGHPRFQRSLPGWNKDRSDGFLLVADDAVGGSFAINGGALGEDIKTIYYYAPDTLDWMQCEFGYTDFLVWAMSERIHEFYNELRWPGWQLEIQPMSADQVMGVYPFLFTKGEPIEKRSRRPVPVAEHFEMQLYSQRQFEQK